MTDKICCNCHWYEGVKAARGCAPCKAEKMVMWDETCDDIWLIPNRLKIGKQTNADRIREMTDEELVKWIVCPHRGEIDLWTCSPSIKCDDCILDWLKQEAE